MSRPATASQLDSCGVCGEDDVRVAACGTCGVDACSDCLEDGDCLDCAGDEADDDEDEDED